MARIIPAATIAQKHGSSVAFAIALALLFALSTKPIKLSTMSKNAPAIFTIGYEGLTIDAFMTLLAKHEIDTVIDIRELPLSRKPGFSKTALAQALTAHGHAYVHIVNLGCPKAVRDQYRADNSWPRYTKGFLKHLGTQSAAIEDVSNMAATRNCVLLCYEADFNFCHRSMVADAVQCKTGACVFHVRHETQSHARRHVVRTQTPRTDSWAVSVSPPRCAVSALGGLPERA